MTEQCKDKVNPCIYIIFVFQATIFMWVEKAQLCWDSAVLFFFTSTISTLLPGKQPGVLVLTMIVSRGSWRSAAYLGGSSASSW